MPYLTKKQLYEFEKDTFINALIGFSGGLDHCNLNTSSEWLWKYYKGEITNEEFDKGYIESEEQ